MDNASQTKSSSRRSESPTNLWVLLILGIFPLVLLELVTFPGIQTFENATYDMRMKLREQWAPQPVDDRIRLVGVSELDEQFLGPDLTNRQAYLELTNRMRAWGAASLTYDIFFQSETGADDLLSLAIANDDLPVILAYHFLKSDRSVSPEGAPPAEFEESYTIARSESDLAVLRQEITFVDDYVREVRSLVDQQRELRFQSANSEGKFTEEQWRALLLQYQWARDLRSELLRRYFQVTNQLHADPELATLPQGVEHGVLSPAIMTSGAHFGFANLEKGREDVVRRVPLFFQWRGELFPQLSLATAMAYYGVSPSGVEIHWGEAIILNPTKNSDSPIRIPIDEDGGFLVNFREGEGYLKRQPLLTSVIRDQVESSAMGDDPAAFFKDAVVLVGEVIAGGEATDVEPIPLQNQFPMVGLHANILNNILQQDYLYELDGGNRMGLAILLGIIGALLFFLLPFSWAAAGMLALLSLYLTMQYLTFQLFGLVMPVINPVLGLLSSTLLFFGYIVGIKERDRRMVKDVFLKSVSPRVGEEILKNYHDESIWGANREITVLFIDIRGYTTMSEKQTPEVVLQILELFYGAVSEGVFRHDGQVNKFMGDAVLAIFGALKEEPEGHAERAIRASLDIQKAIAALNESEEIKALGVPLDTGAGVNTGFATVGLVGRRQLRIEYTALGDAVNVASRLQSAASHGEFMISDKTMELLGGSDEFNRLFPHLDLPAAEALRVKGKEHPVLVYRLKPQ